MSVEAIVAILLVVLAVPLLAWAFIPVIGRPKTSSPAARVRTLAKPGDKVIQARYPRYVATPTSIGRMERNLALAGLSESWSLSRLVWLKAILGGSALVLGIAFFAAQPGFFRFLIAVVVILIGYFAPDVIVRGRAQERQDAIRDELADTLDQITISIEAGLGLETAVARAGQHGSGPLAVELTRTVQDMRVGLSRKEAYSALAERTSVVDLKRFARAVMQADAYGVSVSNVVRTQSKDLRAKRRQRAEEKAMKVPVQVLFPLMLCILPVLFVVVLGPAIVNLASVFNTVGN